MSKAFDTINIHTLIRKLLQTNIPGPIIKFIANYIKGRNTTYRNHTSRQCQFKTCVSQEGVLSPTLFNILHLRLTTTGSGHGLHRWHHHHIYKARVHPINIYNHTCVKLVTIILYMYIVYISLIDKCELMTVTLYACIVSKVMIGWYIHQIILFVLYVSTIRNITL